ncbi:MAG: branched-chain amino acid ABC transporter permease [Pedosphaera sp.]|nr:branched-chain amino acid ABC transporter permease [Pedosphaera sp.]MST01141.1 branched-chain amino acid ABC transporter permease [Pedosphaera sp.]
MKAARSKLIVLAVLAASLGVSLISPRLDPYFLDVILGIGINIILAVSLNLINGHTGQFSLGHAGFMAVGAYLSAALTSFLAPKLLGAVPGTVALQSFFFAALLAGGLGAALAGLLVGIPSLRLRGDYLAIVTLGFGEIIRVILQNMESVGGASGLHNIPQLTSFFWTFGLAGIAVYVIVSLVNSTYGRGFIAVRDDEVAAAAMGINPTRYKVTAFVLGAFWAGIAGGLYAHLKSSLNPTGFDFMRSIEIVVMVILGGMGNTPGVIIAAVLLTLLPVGLRELPTLTFSLAGKPIDLVWKELQMVIYALFIIAMMLLRPQGLFTWAPRKKAGE